MTPDKNIPVAGGVNFHPEELLLSTQVCDKFFRDNGVWEKFRDQTVLDVGCATGFFTERIAAAAARVYSCDISFDNVSACRRLSPSPKIVCLSANAEILPFNSGTFDSVFVNSVVEHLDAPELFFAEVFRVLKPGGEFVMSVDIKPKISWIFYRLTFLFDKMVAPDHPMLHRKTALSDPSCTEFIAPDRLLAALEPLFTLVEKQKFAGLFFNLMQVSLVIVNKLYQIASGSNFTEDHYADHMERLNRPIFRIYRGLLPLFRLIAYPRFLTFDAIYLFLRMKKAF
ncbi:MAG: methyltransferase domain-containing protein [Candidatus Omnitrophota bacterium]